MKQFHRQLWLVIKFVVSEYINGSGSRLAASLAYSTLLAIVPLMLVILSIASRIPAFTQVADEMQRFVLQNFVAGAASSVTTYLDAFLKQIDRLTWTNIAAFFLTSVLLLYNMVAAFNKIWRVQMVFKRQFALNFLYYFSILLLAPVLLATSMLTMSYVLSLSLFASPYVKHALLPSFVHIMPFVAILITFTFFNWVLPTCRVLWRYALISGFISMVLFESIKTLFTLYIQAFPTYRIIYGALATIPIFFVWVYLSWVITLIGAILCKGLQDHFHRYSHTVFNRDPADLS